MDKYSGKYFKKHFANKFEALLAEEYKSLPKRKHRSSFYNAYDNKYPREDGKGIENSAKQWFNLSSSPTIEQLSNICNLYNTDMDYFLSEQKEKNKAIKSASEYLDITEKGIERISNYSLDTITMLNTLICNDNKEDSTDYLENLLNSIWRYKLLAASSDTTITIKNKSYKYNVTVDSKDSEILRYEALKAFDLCMNIDNSIINSIIDIANNQNTLKSKSFKNLFKKATEYYKSKRAKGKTYNDM